MYSYGGVTNAVKVIYANEGAKGLTCGLIPTLLRDAPFSGLYLMFYTQSKQFIPQRKLLYYYLLLTHFYFNTFSTKRFLLEEKY